VRDGQLKLKHGDKHCRCSFELALGRGFDSRHLHFRTENDPVSTGFKIKWYVLSDHFKKTLSDSKKMTVKLLSIYKRNARKNYYADYLIDGKKQSISLDCDKRTQAYTQWNQIKDNIIKKYNEQKALKEKQYLESITLSNTLNHFLETYKTNLQSSTIRSYRWSLLKFNNFLKTKRVLYSNQIKESHLNDFLISLEEDKSVSNKTINNYISILNSFVKFLNKRNYCTLNLINKNNWKKTIKNKIELFDKNQARIIIDRIKQVNDNSYRVILLSPFFTGMRYSELKALNKKNIDLKNRIIYVKEKQTPDDLNPIDTLKTDSAKRKIPILKEFFPIIESFIEETKNEYIFSNINYKKLSNLRRKLVKELNIPFRFHDGRHFFASLLINNRYDFKTIQTLMGHADIRMTFNTYGHIIDTLKAEDFDRINF